MNLRFHIDQAACTRLRSGGTCRRNPHSEMYPCQENCQEMGVSLIVETRTGNPYACMQCRYNPKAKSPPCMFTERRKNDSFEGLLNGKLSGIREIASVCSTDAIKTGDRGIWIDEEKCVGCLLCVASCPISAIAVDQNIRAHLFSPHKSKNDWANACPWGASSYRQTSDSDSLEFQKLSVEKKGATCANTDLVESIGNMAFEKVTFPTRSYVRRSSVHRTSFEEFSMSHEVTMLTPWIGETLKRISDGYVVSTYESGLPSVPGSRYPRLDFCIIHNEPVLIIESKRDEASAKSGIVDQVEKKYREEIKKILDRKHRDKWHLLLAVGGPESELTYNRYLFSLLSSNKIQMVSASFIWCLLAYNLFSGKKLCWRDAISKVFSDNNVVAALASGVVIKDSSNRFTLTPAARFLGGHK